MKDSSRDSGDRLENYFQNQPEYRKLNFGHKVGQKYQTTVRFSGEVMAELGRSSKAAGLPLAEIVRRLTREAIKRRYNG